MSNKNNNDNENNNIHNHNHHHHHHPYHHCRRKCCILSILIILIVLVLASFVEESFMLEGYDNYYYNTEANEGQMQNSTVMSQMRQQHIAFIAQKLSRTYKINISSHTWCVDRSMRFEQFKNRPMGLCFVRIPNVASNLLAAVNRRIAINYGNRRKQQKQQQQQSSSLSLQNNVDNFLLQLDDDDDNIQQQQQQQNSPQINNNNNLYYYYNNENSCIRHDGLVRGYTYAKREQPMSFLWSSIRPPTDRILSKFFHSKSSINYTNSKLLKYLTTIDNSNGRGGYQLEYLSMTFTNENSAYNASYDPTKIINPTNVHHQVQQIMQSYDFIVVLDRLDESLVVLKYILGISLYDLLYLQDDSPYQYKLNRCIFVGSAGNSKTDNNNNDDDDSIVGINGNGNLVGVNNNDNINNNYNNYNETLSPEIVQFLQHSPNWFAQNYGDLLLHKAASIALDRTIAQQIGFENFHQSLQEYQQLKQEAYDECHGRAIFPCSAFGVDQHKLAQDDCYFDNHGCGYKCLNELMMANSEQNEKE